MRSLGHHPKNETGEKWKDQFLCMVIYQTQGSMNVSSHIQTLRSTGFKKIRSRRGFSTNFEVFGYLMKHSFECLILLLKALIICREVQR